MLADILVTNLLMALNFVLIGQIGSAAFLCGVATVQAGLTLVHNQKNTQPGKAEIGIFVVLYLVFGFYGLMSSPAFVPGINARNLLELMPIVGALLNMVFILVKDPRTSRKILLTMNVIWAVYSGIVGATAFFAQIVTMMTTLLAMYRYRNESQPAEAEA